MINQYKNIHTNKSVLILGTGVSLNDFSIGQLSSFAEDKVVFAIKQAYTYCSHLVDYHFVNTNNLSNYSYVSRIPIFGCRAANEYNMKSYMLSICDEVFIIDNNVDFNKSLSATHDFDKWNLERSISRCWGPGIISEICFYMAIWMGFKSIFTLGWCGGKTLDRDHFYSYNVFNPASKLHPKENELETELSLGWYNYLKELGISLNIIGDSYMHHDIPRIEIGLTI